MNIISKNFFDICASALSFYLVGYALSTNAKGGIVGKGKFLTLNFESEDFLDWFYKFSLCTTSSTLVAGSLAERTYVDRNFIFWLG